MRSLRLTLLGVAVLALLTAPWGTATAEVGSPQGYTGAEYGTKLEVGPTESDHQSKLWFHAGAWWAIMRDPAAGVIRVYELMRDHTWRPTDAVVNAAPTSAGDALADGDELFVAGRSGDDVLQVAQLTFDSARRTYRMAPGFPVEAARNGSEAVTIAKDSLDRLWVAWKTSSFVRVAHSDASHRVWTESFPPGTDGTAIPGGGVTAVVAWDAKVGVMWEDQAAGTWRFAVHEDKAPDAAWTTSVVLQGPALADNHLNLVVVPGKPPTLLAAVKTSQGDAGEPPDSPLIMLLARSADGKWSTHVAGTVKDRQTRPHLVVDAADGIVHLFTTPTGGGSTVYSKSARLDDLTFLPGRGVPVLEDNRAILANLTGSKQPVDGTTGIVLLLTDEVSHRYRHVELPIDPPKGAPPPREPDTAAPTAPGEVRAEVQPGRSVALSWSPASDGDRWWPAADTVPLRHNAVYRGGRLVGVTGATTFVDTPPPDAHRLSYRVVAVDMAGNASPPGGVVSVELPRQRGLLENPLLQNHFVLGLAALVVLAAGTLVVQRERARRAAALQLRWEEGATSPYGAGTDRSRTL
jgi:hypothetical protein